MPNQLVLRHATSRDFDQVTEFYSRHQHSNLRERGEDELLQAVRKDRKLFVVTRDAEIVGAAAVFEHCDGRYHEPGAARVVEKRVRIAEGPSLGSDSAHVSQ